MCMCFHRCVCIRPQRVVGPAPRVGGRGASWVTLIFVPSYDVSSNRRILIADAMVSDFHPTIIDT